MYFLPVAVVVACLVAALLQFAALRSPDVTETQATRNARKLTIVGLLVGAIYMVHTLNATGSVDMPFALALGLIAMGQLLFGMHSVLHHLWPELEVHKRC